MRHLILISGPDRTGKTTLANDATEKAHEMFPGHLVEYFHAGVPENVLAPFQQYTDRLQNLPINTVHVWDRGFICAQVYESMYGIRQITTEEVLEAERQILEVFDSFHHFVLMRPWDRVFQEHVEEIARGEGLEGPREKVKDDLARRKMAHIRYQDAVTELSPLLQVTPEIINQTW